MGRTGIAWTDETWNPIVGCSRASAGCQNCYAERMAATRLRHRPEYKGLTKDGRWTGKVRPLSKRLGQPFRWRRSRRIFVNSMGDLFHEAVPDEAIHEVLEIIWESNWHIFQVLTKRPERAAAYFRAIEPPGMPPNLWPGVSVENQAMAEERIPWLLKIPAPIRWMSCEPLLGPVTLFPYALGQLSWRLEENHTGIDWVVVGGETGPGARPMEPAWARSIRDQCRNASVPFFMKQMSGRKPIPEDLMVREYPSRDVEA